MPIPPSQQFSTHCSFQLIALIAPFKCKFLRITNKRNPILFQYSINDSAMQQISHAKYLGVIIDEKLSWNEHILKVTNKARQAFAFLCHNSLNCPAHVKCNIYMIMVRSILEYGSTVWDSLYSNLRRCFFAMDVICSI